MTPAARLSAAIEVMADIEQRRRPASDALKDWGLAHRFAGSGDRAAIAGIAYDALRRKASAAFLMGEDTPRAVLLGMLRLERGMDVGAIARLADGARFAPAPLSEAEQKSLRDGSLAQAPAHIAGDYPEWLDPHLVRVFGEERAQEAAALARRAPLDLRVNTLKADRDKTAKSLDHLKVAPTRWSPVGLRITLAPDAKNIAVHSEPAFLGGLIEVQDEGSQLAALLSGAKPDAQVVDLCAGAGGPDGEPRANLCDRSRQAPARAHPQAAGARRRAQHPGPHPAWQGGPAGRAPRPGRPGGDRRTLHRHRHLAAQPRRQVAGAAGRARRTHQGADGRARPRGPAGPPRRPHRLRDLLGAGRGEWRPGARLYGAPPGIRGRAAGRAAGPARRARFGVPPGGVPVARRAADDPAADGDGWVFCERAGA